MCTVYCSVTAAALALNQNPSLLNLKALAPPVAATLANTLLLAAAVVAGARVGYANRNTNAFVRCPYYRLVSVWYTSGAHFAHVSV